MTDTSILATHSTTALLPVTASAHTSPALNGSLSDTTPQVDEPYTIKCICAFHDDDGNTVFCERCETWQHIECYYHGKNVPDVHNCADCEPRSIDAKRATERQKRLREQNDGGDRKVRRPTTKSHKKKVKDTNATGDQTNGWTSHERQDSALIGRDQPPPAKRPKTSHHTSSSMSSQNGTPVLHPDHRKRASSSAHIYPSPTKSPLNNSYPYIPLYSSEFLHLYDRNLDDIPMHTNPFNPVSVTNNLVQWLENPEALAVVTNGKQPHEVFMRADEPLDPDRWPKVSRQTKVDDHVKIDGRNPTWQYLKLESNVLKGDIVGEVKGQIGQLEDYCHDKANRWNDLRHPEPFVFFHPQLPIYIDSRKEGTQFRYIRRSCQPNVTMKTIITNEREYHFCFIATQDIPAGSELTASWYLDQTLIQRNLAAVKEESSNSGEANPFHIWVSKVLSNFGDCACDRSQTCSFTAFDRRRSSKPIDSINKHTNGRRRMARSKHNISPLSTGQATNSRAGSEAVKNQELDEDDQAESRSTSGSIRSKPRSRDLTPIYGPHDSTSGAGIELTDREKRKIAAAEKQFEQLQQDNQHTHKKKKRTSGGSTLNTPVVGSLKQLGYSATSTSLPTTPSVMMKPSYVDAATSRHPSGSPSVRPSQNPTFRRNPANPSPSMPSAPNIPSVLSRRRPNYVDAATQTDPDEYDPAYVNPNPLPKPWPKFVTPVKRLHEIIREDRARKRAMGWHIPPKILPSDSMPPPVSPTGGSDNAKSTSMASVNEGQEDVEMEDAGAKVDTMATTTGSSDRMDLSAAESKAQSETHSSGSIIKPPPPPWPSAASHSPYLPRQLPNSYRPTELRVQMPPTPHFSNTNPSTPATTTPATTTPSVSQSPFSFGSTTSQHALQTPSSAAVAPIPVKKKLSLGDYMSRRSNLSTPAVEKGQANTSAHAQNQSQSQSSSSPTSTAAAYSVLQTLAKPNLSIVEEATSQGGVEGSAIVDTPMKDVPDPLAATATPADTAATPAAASRDPRLQQSG